MASKRTAAMASQGQPRQTRRKLAALVAAAAPVMRRFKHGFRWSATTVEPYRLGADAAGEFRGAARQVLVGKHGERVKFHVRYFELQPGGFTSLERHHHCHVVIAATGRGRVRVARRRYWMKPFDTIYIGPNRPHQLHAAGRERFGFFCIVDARRDRPRPVPHQPGRAR